jgi:hypothetical protein
MRVLTLNYKASLEKCDTDKFNYSCRLAQGPQMSSYVTPWQRRASR